MRVFYMPKWELDENFFFFLAFTERIARGMVRIPPDQSSSLGESILCLFWACRVHKYILIQIAKTKKEIFILVLISHSLTGVGAFRYGGALKSTCQISPTHSRHKFKEKYLHQCFLVKPNQMAMQCPGLGDLVPYCPEAKIKQPN